MRATDYLHADHLNRPIEMTDTAKNVVWQAHYWPFGEAYSITGSASNNLRFPGQYFLLESGLAYNWYRHYDATLGRYTQPDPLGFVDGPSVYGYVNSSPEMYVDPDGRCGGVCIGLAVAIIATYVLTPDVANSPGPCDKILRSDRLAPLRNALFVAGVTRGGAAVRWAYDLSRVYYKWLFSPGGRLNSNRYFRIGEGKKPSRSGLRKSFRISGDTVERLTGRKHIDLKDLGRWGKREQ